MPTPPRNPYIAGKALGDPRGFFGRADVFRVDRDGAEFVLPHF